jgi:hypothetical protein
VGLLAVRETLGHGNRITPRSAFPQGDGSPGERACYHALLGVPTTMLWEATSSVAKAAPLTHPRGGRRAEFSAEAAVVNVLGRQQSTPGRCGGGAQQQSVRGQPQRERQSVSRGSSSSSSSSRVQRARVGRVHASQLLGGGEEAALPHGEVFRDGERWWRQDVRAGWSESSLCVALLSCAKEINKGDFEILCTT